MTFRPRLEGSDAARRTDLEVAAILREWPRSWTELQAAVSRKDLAATVTAHVKLGLLARASSALAGC